MCSSLACFVLSRRYYEYCQAGGSIPWCFLLFCVVSNFRLLTNCTQGAITTIVYIAYKLLIVVTTSYVARVLVPQGVKVQTRL